MAAPNPNPARISDAMWSLWTRFDAAEPTALLGGILALKAGYHSYRDRLPATDYSTGRDVAADKRGSGKIAAAFDFTMSTAAMIKYTRRLDAAARARDPRLYTPRGPILREFIGTKDGRTVYCYVLVGGRPLGVGADAGPDPGRDSSHLWHLHGSVIREFAGDQAAMDGLLSVLLGEPLATWQAHTQGADVQLTDKIALVNQPDVKYSSPTSTVGGVLAGTNYYVLQTRNRVLAELAEARVRQEAILAKLSGADDQAVIAAVREQGDAIRAELTARAAEDAARDAELAELIRAEGAGELTAVEVLARLKAMLPDPPENAPAPA